MYNLQGSEPGSREASCGLKLKPRRDWPHFLGTWRETLTWSVVKVPGIPRSHNDSSSPFTWLNHPSHEVVLDPSEGCSILGGSGFGFLKIPYHSPWKDLLPRRLPGV